MVAGLSEEQKATGPQPAQHLLYKGLQLLVAQVHQQPVGEDEVEAEGNNEWIN